jgi:hypothetical protein
MINALKATFDTGYSEPGADAPLVAEQPEFRSTSHDSASTVIYPVYPRMHLQVSIEAGSRRYCLREALALRHREDDGMTVVRSPSLSIDGLGSSYVEAVADFCENFDAQYRALAEERDETLSPGALSIAQALRAAVERVEDVVRGADL